MKRGSRSALDSEAGEGVHSTGALSAPARLPWWRRLFGRGLRAARLKPTWPSNPPAVIVACEYCGYDYTYEPIDFGEGDIGGSWSCDCGVRFFPPGGSMSYSWVRP